jgi:hypothetical protein
MVHRALTLFGALILVFGSGVIYAQDESCNPQVISALINQYVQDIKDSSDNTQTVNLLEQLQGEIDGSIENCQSSAPSAELNTDPGSGTFRDPYSFGVAGDSGNGFNLQIVTFIRPADTIIRNANMFNDRPDEGEEYIIIELAVACHERSDRCETNYFDYELVGDEGVVYENPFVVYDDLFEVSLFGGGEQSGSLVFLVRSDDTNLRLLYRPNMFENDVVVYSAEPSLDSGIQIVANTSINVRNAPSTNGSVVTSLPADSPVIAFGRNEEGTWLQISNGWVFAELITTDGDIQGLPVTAQ